MTELEREGERRPIVYQRWRLLGDGRLKCDGKWEGWYKILVLKGERAFRSNQNKQRKETKKKEKKKLCGFGHLLCDFLLLVSVLLSREPNRVVPERIGNCCNCEMSRI
ncbi:hypothetical protein L484_019534 [Morus notabilis]|uniref:Uncharacterized protein n=1 Tax=Morus notabilis TaxID=981085 RepID=W9R3Q4_9ROSA|nr:hypothetical protein L484_019534 [Morus notabilis]